MLPLLSAKDAVAGKIEVTSVKSTDLAQYLRPATSQGANLPPIYTGKEIVAVEIPPEVQTFTVRGKKSLVDKDGRPSAGTTIYIPKGKTLRLSGEDLQNLVENCGITVFERWR